MSLLEGLVKVYQSYTYKVVLYPLLCILIGGVLWSLIVTQLTEILGMISLGFLFGLSSAYMSIRFGLGGSVWHSLLLIVLVILSIVLTLWAGLYFGAYFVPIAVGNLVFAFLFFMLDYFYGGKTVGMTAVILYLLAALAAILIIYSATILDWRRNIGWLYLVTYPLVIYVYLQVSLYCRLMFNLSSTS